MPKTALICGISGQDGCYFASHLLDRGYQVWGTSRDKTANSFEMLRKLRLFDSVNLLSLDLLDSAAIGDTLRHVRPDVLFNLSGQTSVGLSFDKPLETFQSIATATLNLLEAVRQSRLEIRLYNAGSVEAFGDTGSTAATEEHPLKPSSPYAVAKAAAFWSVSAYRQAYSMFVCTGILSNHESPLRPARFVTRKIINAVARIASGHDTKLTLGNVDVERDWGWAPEYVDASVRMLEQSTPEDYVIATGQTSSLLDFVKTAFDLVDLNWRDHVVIDEQLRRPTDIARISLNPAKAAAKLGWQAKSKMRDVAKLMLEAEMQTLTIPAQHH